MLKHQSELPLSPHSALYDILIPKNNDLRRLNELVDFSFVYANLRIITVLGKDELPLIRYRCLSTFTSRCVITFQIAI